ATTGSWVDRVRVFNTTTGTTLKDDTVIYDATTLGNLAGGASKQRPFSFVLPDGSAGAGNLQITVTVDSTSQVPEYNSNGNAETNNDASIPPVHSTLTPYPDLKVVGLGLSTESVLESGGLLKVLWNDANSGNAPVSSPFVDHVIITNTTTGQTLGTLDIAYDPAAAGNGPIGAGQSRDRHLTFALPQGTSGAGLIQFTVTTDYY